MTTVLKDSKQLPPPAKKTKIDLPPLIIAINEDNFAIFEALLPSIQDIELLNRALFKATRLGRKNMVAELLKNQNLVLTTTDNNGDHILRIAVAKGNGDPFIVKQIARDPRIPTLILNREIASEFILDPEIELALKEAIRLRTPASQSKPEKHIPQKSEDPLALEVAKVFKKLPHAKNKLQITIITLLKEIKASIKAGKIKIETALLLGVNSNHPHSIIIELMDITRLAKAMNPDATVLECKTELCTLLKKKLLQPELSKRTYTYDLDLVDDKSNESSVYVEDSKDHKKLDEVTVNTSTTSTPPDSTKQTDSSAKQKRASDLNANGYVKKRPSTLRKQPKKKSKHYSNLISAASVKRDEKALNLIAEDAIAQDGDRPPHLADQSPAQAAPPPQPNLPAVPDEKIEVYHPDAANSSEPPTASVHENIPQNTDGNEVQKADYNNQRFFTTAQKTIKSDHEQFRAYSVFQNMPF